MSNPYLKRNERQQHGQRSEKRTTRRLRAQRQPGSGAIEGAKGDFKLNAYRGECKATNKDSFSVKLAHLEKISEEALAAGKVPVLTVTFVTGNGEPRRHGAWVLMPEWQYREIEEHASVRQEGDTKTKRSRHHHQPAG